MKTDLKKETDAIYDENGQLYPDCLIINTPNLKNMPLLFGEGVLTILFWGLWFYLWLPVISLIAWWMGFNLFYKHMVELGGFSGFIKFLDVFLSGILFLCGALYAWSLYNRKRYGSYHRRHKILTTDMNQMADSINVSKEKLHETQMAKRVSFSFAADNSVNDVKLFQPGHSPEKKPSSTLFT